MATVSYGKGLVLGKVNDGRKGSIFAALRRLGNGLARGKVTATLAPREIGFISYRTPGDLGRLLR